MNTQPKATNPILKLHPKQSEAKKVSVDDGYTAIPNALLDAILKFDFSNAQRKVVLAVLRKTLSWHKEMDWICNEQLAEMANLPDISKASRTKNELLRMKVLVQDGKKIGVNLVVSEWENEIVQNDKTVQNNKQNCTKRQKVLYETTTTKETITKEKINISPHTPQGGGVEKNVDEKILTQANELLAYYNDLAKSTCRSAEPFFKLLQKTTCREAYAVDDIKIVIRWALSVWKNRTGKPKPENICRVKRFDGYLADATAWAKYADFDTQTVIETYNDILGERLIPIEDDDDYAAQQILDLLPRLEHKTVSAFKAYFQAFANNANPYYFEPERKIGFSFLMKPETLMKTRRGEI
ncbi:hypothetical protein X808_8870 [Mannheimia varigena USDA-ARS-USMARC-1296]|uniref:Bacteriophage lambda Replication protein O N-terminal domain-containing protein n=1 Tax=Mannheimia varigena USDA-ARS-USMARC-1296 TaxID=1433287 RepID=W0QC50_9PAST|nr:replication protein [Mannheimia varigena]AHG75410.1 hypothetical protein X808_8870 [Mannheimia varigena USDA-ARS-USMARC-1296]